LPGSGARGGKPGRSGRGALAGTIRHARQRMRRQRVWMRRVMGVIAGRSASRRLVRKFVGLAGGRSGQDHDAGLVLGARGSVRPGEVTAAEFRSGRARATAAPVDRAAAEALRRRGGAVRRAADRARTETTGGDLLSWSAGDGPVPETRRGVSLSVRRPRDPPIAELGSPVAGAVGRTCQVAISESRCGGVSFDLRDDDRRVGAIPGERAGPAEEDGRQGQEESLSHG